MRSITRCPKKEVTRDAWDAVLAAELWAKGVLPEGGGWLDQAASGRDAVLAVEAERARWEKPRETQE